MKIIGEADTIIVNCQLSTDLEVVEIDYRNLGTKKRTILRFRGVFLRDVQALPPWGWCESCGKEVYGKGQCMCRKCKGNKTIDN